MAGAGGVGAASVEKMWGVGFAYRLVRTRWDRHTDTHTHLKGQGKGVRACGVRKPLDAAGPGTGGAAVKR